MVVSGPSYESHRVGTGRSLESSYQKLKLVKRGHRANVEPEVCGVSFECLPAWLWALRLSDWSSILITDTDELQLRQYHVSTWSFVKDKLSIIPASGHPTETRAIVWFVSGSRDFVDSFNCPTNIPVVFGWNNVDVAGRRTLQILHGSVWHMS